MHVIEKINSVAIWKKNDRMSCYNDVSHNTLGYHQCPLELRMKYNAIRQKIKLHSVLVIERVL